MTAIKVPEVVVGIVGFLNQSELQSNEKIEHTVFQKKPRSGPFICIKVDGINSWWTAITTKSITNNGVNRIFIPKNDRFGKNTQWMNRGQDLNDGASIYFGPTSEFCKASTRETTKPDERSFASANAVTSIMKEVKNQQNRQIKKLTINPY